MAVFSLLSDRDKAELWSCLALKYTRGLGLHSANALIKHYGSAFEAVELGRRAPGCWVSEGLVSERAARAFANESWRGKARHEWEALQGPGRQFLFRTHSRYPQLLAEIHDAPLVLYYDGDIRLLANPMIGVVGSRKCSEAGLLACAVLTRQLSSFGVTIISGLARGIDRAAHIAGLSALGSSVAVLGTGIDVIYPESNEDVFGVLQEKGLILSEFLPGTVPHAKNFPIRNRIISGLSRGVLIVEAAKRSGSLITARLALEQGRDVFAIPGSSVGKYSEGCHELIRNGAKPVFSAEDIVLDLAPLLTIDVEDQLARLKNQEAPGSVNQLSKVLHDEVALPPLLEPARRAQGIGYSYNTKALGSSPSGKTSTAQGAGQVQQSGATNFTASVSALFNEPASQPIPAIAPVSRKDTSPDLKVRQEVIGKVSPKDSPDASAQVSVKNTAAAPLKNSAGTPSKSNPAISPVSNPGSNSSSGQFSAMSAPPLTELEQRLVTLLRDDWQHIDWLSEALGVDTAQVSTALTLLEVGGVIVQKPGMFYRLAEK